MSTADEQAVWALWNSLPDDYPTPVTAIAAVTGLSKADVAAIVYPVPQFSVWSDDQEEGS